MLKALSDLVIPPWMRWAAAGLALVGAFWGGWTVATWRADAQRTNELRQARAAERRAWERVVEDAKVGQAIAESLSAGALADVARYQGEAELLRAAFARAPLIEYREVPVREGETVVRVAARGARYRLCFNAAVSGAAADRAACEAAGVHESDDAPRVPAAELVRPSDP